MTWARVLGFDVIAAGKASEHEYVFDPVSTTVRYRKHVLPAPELPGLLRLDSPEQVLARRREAIADLPQSAISDYSEMTVVANCTGLVPASAELSHPLCRITELADVFIPAAAGGILERTGVVDVFNYLRFPDEASFAGGVFIVIRCHDLHTWQMLRRKGHVVSRNGDYACVWQPYHLLGLETPMSIFSAVLHGRPTGGRPVRRHVIMAARATRDMPAGETLAVGGDHHDVHGLHPLVLPADEAPPDVAPFYLAAGQRLRRDVRRGTTLTLDMVDLDDTLLARAWHDG